MKLPANANENSTSSDSGIMPQLQTILSEKDSLIAEQSDIIDKKSDVIDSLTKRIESLEEYLRLSNSKRFGKSAEQTPPEQGE